MWLGSYQTSITGVAVFKETKYCEQCGRITIRVVGSTDKYCKSCHVNWNHVVRLDAQDLLNFARAEVMEAEVEKAPKGSCRMKRPRPVKKSKTKAEIKAAIWNNLQ
jgi:hypothetical protein